MSHCTHPEIRLAGLHDSGALHDLRRAWARERAADTADSGFEERFETWLEHESERRVFWLAACDGAPVGMVNLMLFRRMPYPNGTAFKDTWGYLGNLFVIPAHRGRGLGARLVAAVTSYADAHDLARVVLSPSAASIPLYERSGFTPATGLMVRAPTR